jgi:hypothetical protein
MSESFSLNKFSLKEVMEKGFVKEILEIFSHFWMLL